MKIKTWQERVNHGDSIYAKASALEEEIRELRAALVELEGAVRNVHKAKGRHHSQLSMCDLYDLVELPNTRPIKAAHNIKES